ncbi:DUF4942 domain-containing protein [Yersinia pseudotuberculosis]|uniref:DUF4942 domain-containing protein n=1 Tax=Yersinia pseudotuberculosis TaxID=633 RepID=UPI00061C4611|nr:DUF4942 domain-containing protein [Yersinia pseudotuberculosis]AXY35662.1 DUF4942 domain-containing protein [Yersinia pseudotuberculosis]AYX11325.1 DUF4942 domain-containing protein [Yersinia pseudotuberculosis]PEI15229.1 DUF4942 domain-containing protein [Yersinia pseudotuberculosis]CNI39552.1 z1226 protein [Yersinia pseudotuberculosis]CNI94213.1 z1226 protein [Yersinia pseudotuberculosis]
MSEIQVNNDPDVITGHTEIISSTSIERIVTGRNAALLQIEQLIHQLDSISILTSSIGGKSARDWAMRQDFRCGCWLMENVKTAMSTITRNLDRSIWRDLMKKSGMISLMDAQARKQWDNNLEGDDIPEISEANILSTFEQLHHNKADVFERGIINVFKGLSWDYKTNSPYQFGKKIIVNNLVNHNRWGFKLNSGWRRDQLADLERMLFLLDGKPIPENCHDVTVRLSEHINQQSTPEIFDDAYFSIRYFQKGSAHITFNRPELIERMNDIIVKHYPAMLASR